MHLMPSLGRNIYWNFSFYVKRRYSNAVSDLTEIIECIENVHMYRFCKNLHEFCFFLRYRLKGLCVYKTSSIEMFQSVVFAVIIFALIASSKTRKKQLISLNFKIVSLLFRWRLELRMAYATIKLCTKLSSKM